VLNDACGIQLEKVMHVIVLSSVTPLLVEFFRTLRIYLSSLEEKMQGGPLLVEALL